MTTHAILFTPGPVDVRTRKEFNGEDIRAMGTPLAGRSLFVLDRAR